MHVCSPEVSPTLMVMYKVTKQLILQLLFPIQPQTSSAHRCSADALTQRQNGTNIVWVLSCMYVAIAFNQLPNPSSLNLKILRKQWLTGLVS